VVHVDLPDTLEAYYQEAGRAGRDEQKAYAILLYDEQDIEELRERMQEANPSIEQLKKIYQHLANYYQVAAGTHAMVSYDFDWEAFASRYELKPSAVYQAIKRLENEGLIQLNEGFFQPDQLHMLLSQQEIYAFQVANALYDPIIKAILRLYGGELLADFCKISVHQIARHLNSQDQLVIQQLHQLEQLSVVQYIPQKDKPQLTFLTSRYLASQIPIDAKQLNQRNTLAMSKMDAVIHYVTHPTRCRTQILLEYFDEISYEACGVCDICLAKSKQEILEGQAYKQARELLLQQLREGLDDVRSIVDRSELPEETVIATIRRMLDNEEIRYDQSGRLVIKNR
jgi:ATP-dependent DNA helicase RecQ